MGGMLRYFDENPAPQYQDQTFNNDQVLQYAKNGYGKDMADAYRAEVLNQLRNGSFKDANGVYQNLMNNAAREQLMAAYSAKNQQSDVPLSWFGATE